MTIPAPLIEAAYMASTSETMTRAEAQAMLEAAFAVDGDRCPVCGCDDIEHASSA